MFSNINIDLASKSLYGASFSHTTVCHNILEAYMAGVVGVWCTRYTHTADN